MPDEPRWLADIAEKTAELEGIFGTRDTDASILLRHVRELREALEEQTRWMETALPSGAALPSGNVFRVRSRALLNRQEPPEEDRDGNAS